MTAVCALGYKQAAALRAADQAHTLPTNRTISGLTTLPYLTGCASLYTHGEKARREAEPSPLTRSGSAAAVPAAFAFYPTFYLFYSPSMDPAIGFPIGGASICPIKPPASYTISTASCYFSKPSGAHVMAIYHK